LANVVGKHREIFLGQLHPLQVLFAKTKTSPQQQHANRTTGQAVTGGATDVYTEAVLARVHKGVIKAAVAHLCSLAVNQSRQLRILEVGAGTGSTALPVLELLTTDYPGVCVEYAFTDLGTHFVNAFGKKYSAEYDFLRPAPLDIAKDPRTQGFASSEYDIVIVRVLPVHFLYTTALYFLPTILWELNFTYCLHPPWASVSTCSMPLKISESHSAAARRSWLPEVCFCSRR
jgi:hypothetical protein